MSAVPADLPALPDDTDLTVSPLEDDPDRLEVTIRPVHAAEMIRGAWMWLLTLLTIAAVAGLGATFALRDTDYAWVGIVVATPLGLLGLIFIQIPAMVKKRSASVIITPEELSISEQHLDTTASVSFNRSDVNYAEQGRSPEREWLYWEGRNEPGAFFGLRRGQKAQLDLLLNQQHQVGVLAGWEAHDLAWLAQTLRQRWGLSRSLATRVDVERSQVGIEQMHNNAQELQIAGPGTALLLGGLGIVLMVMGLWSLPQGIMSLDWQSVEGTIVDAQYIVRGSAGDRSYTATATYTYEFDGAEYRGDRVSFAYQAGADRVRELIEPLGPDDAVTVFVDPANPAQSVLIPGFDAAQPLIIGMGLLAVLGGVWVWRRHQRIRRELGLALKHASEFTEPTTADVPPDSTRQA